MSRGVACLACLALLLGLAGPAGAQQLRDASPGPDFLSAPGEIVLRPGSVVAWWGLHLGGVPGEVRLDPIPIGLGVGLLPGVELDAAVRLPVLWEQLRRKQGPDVVLQGRFGLLTQRRGRPGLALAVRATMPGSLDVVGMATVGYRRGPIHVALSGGGGVARVDGGPVPVATASLGFAVRAHPRIRPTIEASLDLRRGAGELEPGPEVGLRGGVSLLPGKWLGVTPWGGVTLGEVVVPSFGVLVTLSSRDQVDPDRDLDELGDWTDLCPAEAEDLDDWQDEDGCPEPDNDGDGIPDEFDPTPNGEMERVAVMRPRYAARLPDEPSPFGEARPEGAPSADPPRSNVPLPSRPDDGPPARILDPEDPELLALSPVDSDGDTWSPRGGDCDDADPKVHPRAIEQCDGLDNNCDGQVDEPRDSDLDGYLNCDGDCDDGDGQVYPGAAELCDGRDNDCDGEVDERDDRDMDGWSPCDGDCDDWDDRVHPDLPDRCDLLDDDCDGEVDEDAVGDRYEPNDFAEEAWPLVLDGAGTTVRSTIHGRTDRVDWFRIEVPEAAARGCQELLVEAWLESIAPGADYDLELYDRDQEPRSVSIHGGRSSEHVNWPIGCVDSEEAAMVFVAVRRQRGWACDQAYVLSVSVSAGHSDTGN